MSGLWAVQRRRPHRAKARAHAADAPTRGARAGTVPFLEYRCSCGLLYRYAHPREARGQCPISDQQAHEYLLCPAHAQHAICVTHVAGFAEDEQRLRDWRSLAYVEPATGPGAAARSATERAG